MWQRVRLFNQNKNHRLLAALHYFHVACRLRAVGHSPREFMAEIILNFAKILQVLFGQSRDDIRNPLTSLGYAPRDIESDFIPILVLRNEFNVGHVMVSILPQSQLSTVHHYLDITERRFRDLFNRLITEVESGRLEFGEDEDLRLDGEKTRLFERVLISIAESLASFKAAEAARARQNDKTGD